MKLPQYTDYQSAVQSPHLAFKEDPDLRVCRVETDPFGRPRVRAGNFAYIYRLRNGNRQWAVRCFARYVPEPERYDLISRFIRREQSDCFVPTDYLSRGILVGGQWYPIIKMEWKEGQTLGSYIEKNIDSNPGIINHLLNQFYSLVATLERLKIAHGDLQHGNILVSNGRLLLLDYDGMFVPGMEGFESKERGHPNYQHPARDKEFGPYLDRFSIIVMYLSLKGLSYDQNLWNKYNNGDNLLFRQSDFLSPDTSPLLKDLESVTALQPLVRRFRTLCKSSIDQIPTLNHFLEGKISSVLPGRKVVVSAWGQYEVLDATQRLKLLARAGERVTVVGQITGCYRGTTRYGKPYAFLNFGNWRNGDFKVVIWSEALKLFQDKGKDPESYEGLWVSVTGLLEKYQNERWPSCPEIEVESPAEIEILSGPEEARQRIAGQADVEPSKAQANGTDASTNTLTSPSSENLELAQQHFERARYYDEEEGRLDKAIKEYETALQLDPNYTDAYCNLGFIYERQGRLERAIAVYVSALQINPISSWIYLSLGRVYYRKRRYRDAIEVLSKGLEIEPQNAYAHVLMGLAYSVTGQLDEGINELKEALRIDSCSDLAYLNLGLAYSQKGRYDHAADAYKEAIRINPKNKLAHYNLGVLYLSKGETALARRELELALQYGYEPARKLLREMNLSK